MSEYSPDLGTLARRVEARLVGWGWLVRSMPDDAGGGYFANITTPDFRPTGDPTHPFTGGVNSYSGPTAEAALAGALALAESRRGEAGEVIRLRGGRLGQALWHLRQGGRVRRESWPAGDYLTLEGGQLTYHTASSGGPGPYLTSTVTGISSESVLARDWETLDGPAASPPAAAKAPLSEEAEPAPVSPESSQRIVAETLPPMAPIVEQLVADHHRLVTAICRRLIELDDGGVDNGYLSELLAMAEEKFEACNFKSIVVGSDGRRVLGGRL